MTEIKSFAADATWVVVDAIESFFRDTHRQRYCLGVTAYLIGAFLLGNGLSEVWTVVAQSAT
jgi:hypothetical protein